MDIIIHGTKGGYKVLHETSDSLRSIARDVRRIDVANDRATVGQYAYSIAFANNGYICSRYDCVWDVERNAIGNIAFSVHIPNSKLMAGNRMKSLLDELAEKYKQEYIIDGNLGSKQEDWNSFDEIVKNYKNYERENYYSRKNFKTGTAEAAFIYYPDEKKLEKYFEEPHQSQYEFYKQVFLIDKKYENNLNNPLNALRHEPSNNLSEGINLNNPIYTLHIRKRTDKYEIDVKEDGSSRKEEDGIHLKNELKISYYKPCHKRKTIDGTIEKFKENNDNISVDETKRIITIEECDLEPKIYTFNFTTIDQNTNNPINEAIVIAICQGKEEELPNKTFSDTYENSKKYTIYAKKAPYLESDKQHLELCFSAYDPPEDTFKIPLYLKERPKEIKIIVKDEGNQPIYGFEVFNKSRRINSDGNIIKFYKNDIKEETKIFVEKHGYAISESQLFTPEQQNEPIIIILKKRSESDKEENLQPKKDKKILDKRLIPLAISGFIAFVILIICVIYFSKKDSKLDGYPKPDENQTKERLNGITIDSSYLDTLQKFCTLDFFDKIFMTSLPSYCPKRDMTMKIYNNIKLGNIDTLKQITYSKKQEKFDKAIKDIELEYKRQIGDSLKNIAKRYGNLDSVATERIKSEIDDLEKAKSNIKNLDSTTIARIESEMNFLIKGDIDSLKKEKNKINSDSVATTRIESEIENKRGSFIKSKIDSLKKEMININLDSVASFITRYQNDLKKATNKMNSDSTENSSTRNQDNTKKETPKKSSSSFRSAVSSSSKETSGNQNIPKNEIDKFENSFWELIKKEDLKIEDFEKLHQKYNKSIKKDNEVLNTLNLIVKNKRTQKLTSKSLKERKKITTLEELNNSVR